MVKLEHLPDDCLLMVLDQLPPEQWFRMLRVNKRMNRLAMDRIEKIKAISFARDFNPTECKCHLTSINQNQILVLQPFFDDFRMSEQVGFDFEVFQDASKRRMLLNVLSKCANVKSINFGSYLWPKAMVINMVSRCPELECVKFSNSSHKEQEWMCVLEEMGHQLVHLVKEKHHKDLKKVLKSDAEILNVARNCINIKRIDWGVGCESLIRQDGAEDFIKALKMLPKTWWIKLDCNDFSDGLRFNASAFDKADVNDIIDSIDELDIETLDWSLLDHRIESLSSLTFRKLLTTRNFNENDINNEQVPGVEFVSLKKLDVSECLYEPYYYYKYFNYLIASQFPQLEEFSVNASNGLGHNVYESLLKQMTSIKRLNIVCNRRRSAENYPNLPGLAAVYPLIQVRNLEAIHVIISGVPNDWRPKSLLEKLEHYVDEIKSLKTLTVEILRRGFDWESLVIEGVGRLKQKQKRVVVTCVCKVTHSKYYNNCYYNYS